MYQPLQTGIPRNLAGVVHYNEFLPDGAALPKMVSCFWILDSRAANTGFEYLVLPDGCIDLVFDTSLRPEFTGALIMTPSLKAELIYIRPKSIYAGIRLLPGAWRVDPVQLIGKANTFDTLAGYSFIEATTQFPDTYSQDKIVQTLLSITEAMHTHGIIGVCGIISLLLAKQCISVQEMVDASGYSRRQLQRILHERVGYAPHDFLKTTRFQYALQDGKLAAEQYADQSHFIRECKRITNMAPVQLRVAYQLISDSF